VVKRHAAPCGGGGFETRDQKEGDEASGQPGMAGD
jgi:hypothetical protein